MGVRPTLLRGEKVGALKKEINEKPMKEKLSIWERLYKKKNGIRILEFFGGKGQELPQTQGLSRKVWCTK